MTPSMPFSSILSPSPVPATSPATDLVRTPWPAEDCPHCGAASGHWPHCPKYPNK